MHPARAVLFAAGVFTFAACSGMGGSSTGAPIVPAQPQTEAIAGSRVTATVTINVPRRRHHRSARYVSPSTRSIVISAQATTARESAPIVSYANLAPGANTVKLAGLAADVTYAFTLVTYDRKQTSGNAPYAGHALSENTVAKKIVLGAANTIHLTLEGVPASFAVAPVIGATPSPFGGGVPSGLYFGVLDTPTWTVTALDADQNYIVGPGSPAITASVSGVTGGVAIAAAPGSNPNRFVVSATGIGSATLKLTAGTSTPLNVSVPLHSGTYESTIAGVPQKSGYQDGPGNQAWFSTPEGMAVSPHDGDIYLADYYNCSIRKVDPATHVVSTVAGGGPSHCSYQNGSGTTAWFNQPCDVVFDSSGNLYVADYSNDAIREITPAGVVSLLSGHQGDVEVDGAPGTAAFAGPVGVAYDPDDNDLYVTDYDECTVRQVTLSGSAPGTVKTIAGTGTCGTTGSEFKEPEGLVYAGNQTLYVTSYCLIRKITNIDTTPVVDTNAAPFAGNNSGCSTVDGTGSTAGFSFAYYLDYDSVRKVLYVSDDGTSIRKVTVPGAVVSTIVGAPATQGLGVGWNQLLWNPDGVVYDAALNALFETDNANQIVQEIAL